MARFPDKASWAPRARRDEGGAPSPEIIRHQHSLDPRGVLFAVGVLLGGVVLLLLLRAIIGPLVFIAITIAIAEALRPPVELLHRRGVARGPAVLLVYGLIAAVVFVIASYLLAPFLAQAGGLIRNFPSYVGQAQREINRLQTLMSDQHIPAALGDQVNALATNLLHTVISIPQQIFNVLVTGLVMAFLIFFWLTSTPQLRALLVSITPPRSHRMLLDLLAEESHVLGGWLRGTLINMALLGAVMSIALLALKVPYALLLGIFAGLTQTIPYVGPWISGLPTIILAYLTAGPTHAAWVAATFVAVQEVASIVFTPLVVRSTVRLHPFVVTCAFLIGAAVYGYAGVIIAVPLAAALQVPIVRLLIPALRRRARADASPAPHEESAPADAASAATDVAPAGAGRFP